MADRTRTVTGRIQAEPQMQRMRSQLDNAAVVEAARRASGLGPARGVVEGLMEPGSLAEYIAADPVGLQALELMVDSYKHVPMPILPLILARDEAIAHQFAHGQVDIPHVILKEKMSAIVNESFDLAAIFDSYPDFLSQPKYVGISFQKYKPLIAMMKVDNAPLEFWGMR